MDKIVELADLVVLHNIAGLVDVAVGLDQARQDAVALGAPSVEGDVVDVPGLVLAVVDLVEKAHANVFST